MGPPTIHQTTKLLTTYYLLLTTYDLYYHFVNKITIPYVANSRDHLNYWIRCVFWLERFHIRKTEKSSPHINGG